MDELTRIYNLWQEHTNYSENSNHEISLDKLDDKLIDIHGKLILDDTFVAGLVIGFLRIGVNHIETHINTLINCISDLELNLKQLDDFVPMTNVDQLCQERYINLANRLLEMSRILYNQIQHT